MTAQTPEREKLLRHLAVTTDRKTQDVLLDHLNRIRKADADAAQEAR